MCERAICDVEILSSNEQCCSLSLSTDTFFVEFKAEALTWSPDLTKEYHNTFIHTANKIVGIVSLFSRIKQFSCFALANSPKHFQFRWSLDSETLEA